jgi:class 3 adenylate cyclase/predicted ATPase
MTFQDVLKQAVIWLQRDKRVSDRALKRHFNIDDPYLDDLKEAIFYTYPKFAEEDGRGVVWIAESETPDTAIQQETRARFQALLPVMMLLLQRQKRVTYTALKYIFGIDDALLGLLREELLFRKVVRDEQGKGIVWAGETPPVGNSSFDVEVFPATAEVSRVALPIAPVFDPPVRETERSRDETTPSPVMGVNSPEAERRHLTVMFCDMAESTKLAGQLDPEDLREIMRAYQATAASVIQHYESYIAQYLGDGLLVYFGWPQAHEDDAQRAVYTGLGIIDAITASLNTRLEGEKGIRLAVRIGIHTGPVVVGAMCDAERCEQLATGETVNIAAPLQGIAAPNSVVVSDTTAHLLQETFVLEDLGLQALKGVAEPMRVSRVQGVIEGYAIKKHDASLEAPFLVGRDEEVGLLMRRWEQSKAGVGQVVLISGEAGIGKSILVEGLYAQLADEAGARITFRCSQYHRNSALYPVITHIEQVFGFSRDDTSDMKVGKMERVLQTSSRPLQEAVPILAALLSVPLPEDQYPERVLSPQSQRQQTQDLLVAWLQEEAEQQPALVVWEDLHWADASTLELLELFVNQAPTVKMLHVLTFRLDFVSPWVQRSHMTPMVINRLEKTHVDALIRHLAGGMQLPQEVIDHIVIKADGVPLYVEELTKTVLESSLLEKDTDRYVLTGPLSSVAIPATLHDSLMARLDRVPIAREIAQLGAVLGREFTYEMLQALATVEEPVLLEGLSRLVEHELLYQRGRPPRSKYIFKHALVHEAAYRSLLRRNRRLYHRAAAELMEKQFPELVRTEPEIVAYHYSEADCPEQAITYLHQAGRRAQQRSAHVEAIAHLTKALKNLATLPETAERSKDELEMLLALGPSLIAIKGYAAQEAQQLYSRARVLCRQMGETAQLFQTLLGLWGFYLVRANHQEALKVGKELLELAHGTPDTIYRIQSHLTLGGTLFCLAEFVPASEHLEKGAELYAHQNHRAYTSLADLGVFCSAWASQALWHIGYPDRALTRSREAVKLSEELAHPFSMALALNYAAIFHQFRREPEAAYQRAEAAIVICKAQKFAYYLGWAKIIRGWAIAEQGDCDEGEAVIQSGLRTLQDTGAKRSMPYYRSLLAEVYSKSGQLEKGMQTISAAFVEAENIGERWWEAELYRLKGALLLRQSTPDDIRAEDCFQQALSVARRQQSIALELRAAASLYHLWQQQGKRDNARQLLFGVYNRLTEGFDTPDVKEAKGLLDEMS